MIGKKNEFFHNTTIFVEQIKLKNMIYGNLQRRWQEEKPALFDKETRIVCLDIKKEVKTIIVDEEVEGRRLFFHSSRN